MKYLSCNFFPPQNYLAEEILLGTILINPRIFPEIITILKADSFFLECHQIIYISFININKKNKLDSIQLLYYLCETETLISIGGINKIMEIMKQSQIFMPSIKISRYLKDIVYLINEKYIKRLMIQYGYNIIRLAYINQFPSYKLYNRSSYYLNSTLKKIPRQNLDSFEDLIGDLLLNLSIKHQTNINNIVKLRDCIPSGFKTLDEMMKGLSYGDLIVIAGRPSMGKTSLAIHIAYKVSTNIKLGVSIFSLEMSRMQILQKLVSIASSISVQNIAFNTIDHDQWITIQKTCNELLISHIYINDTSNMSIDYIQYTSKLLKKETRYVELIIIDYLQLIHLDNTYKNNRTQELSYITRKLKLLAQDLKVPIIILSQLNRNIENRSNKKPILSDLRESGCIYILIFTHLENINQLSIKNISCYKNYSLNNFPHIKYSNPIKNTIQIYLQYIFICKTNWRINIKITYNHKLYKKLAWVEQYLIEENFTIFRTQNYYLIENYYLDFIKYKYYKKVYDIEVSKYTNIICNCIILHNSIEQDADIVMMLHQDNNITIEYTTLNIFLCKNRNGPTGLCKLLFHQKYTYFQELEKDDDMKF